MSRSPRSTSRLTRATLGVATLAATAIGLGALSAPTATAAPDDTTAKVDRSAVSPGLVAAMKRDLGLDADQVRARLDMEARAPAISSSLEKELGSSWAGSWIAEGATRLTVATTDRAEVAAIRQGGARAVVVRHSERELTADRASLDQRAATAAAAIHSWYVDVPTNSVVVTAAPGARRQAKAFAARSGAGSVRVVTSAEAPRTVADIRGGDEYVINNSTLCSVGFAVNGGFVTAGHCGGVGSTTTGFGQAQGTFEQSSFPGNDYAFVRTNGNWVSQPWVYNYAGQAVLVFGSQDAAVGSSICRSGRTSQWTCGTLQGREETVNYGSDVVYGLSRMSACANPGDSGGSVISGNQAQGVTSGIAGGCGSSNPQTWFQPVNEILGAYGLSLTTG